MNSSNRLWAVAGKTAAVIALYTLLPLLAFFEIIFDDRTLYWRDLTWIHYPRHIFAASEWLAGRLPLWDPYQHNGLPFLAETQVGALYPFSFLFLSPLTPSLELSLFIVLHFTMGAIFTFILARGLGQAYPAATLAGLSFGMGGFLMAQVTNLNIMTGAVWLPLILHGAIQTTRRRHWLLALLAGLPLALQISTAQPQIVFYTLVTLAGYGLYRLIADWQTGHGANNWRFQLKTGGLLLAMVSSGLLLAAPQWLATLELQQQSVRSAGRSLGFLTQNSLPPVMWLNLLLPSVFGNNVVDFAITDPFQEDFIYLGFIPLLLVFFSLSQRQRPDMLFFGLLFVSAALLALGKHTPLYEYVVQYLPGFALFRIPARWLMVVNLSMAVLAGFGLHSLLTQGLSRRQWLFVAGTSLASLLGLGLVWLAGPSLAEWSAAENRRLLRFFLDNGFAVDAAHTGRLLARLTPPAVLLLFNTLAALLLFGLLAAKKIKRDAFGLLLLAAVSIDLVAAGGLTINPTKPASWWQELSGGAAHVLARVDDARVFPLGMGSEQATVENLGQYFPSVYQVRSAGGHGSSLMLARISTFLDDSHPVQAVQNMAVRYLLTEGEMGADAAATFPIAYRDDKSVVYEYPEPLPRLLIVHQALVEPTAAAALAHFEGMALDPRQTVVLESETSLPTPTEPERPSRFTIIAETPQQLTVDVDLAAPGYLVWLDTFYPGWQAAIDGKATPIYRANYLSRAVFVPAGQHRLTFAYRPVPFWLGVGLTTLTLLLIGLLAVISYRRKQIV